MKSSSFYPSSGWRGFSLTELLVAISIGVLLIGGVIYAFVASFISFRTNDALARVQENGRLTLGMLERDLRLAGFQGCARTDDERLKSLPAERVNLEWLAQGIGRPSVSPGVLNPEDGAGFSLIGGREGFAELKDDAEAGEDTTLLLTSTPASKAIQKDSLVIVGDCDKGELFRAKTVTVGASEVTVEGTLKNTYSDKLGVLVQPVQEVTYRFEPPAATAPAWKRGHDGGNHPIGVLRRQEGSEDEVLVEDVEIFRVCVREDGAATSTIVTPAAAIDWDKVTLVEVDLLLVGPSEQGKNQVEQTYALCGGGTYNPNDTLLRKLFSTRVDLRNKFGA